MRELVGLGQQAAFGRDLLDLAGQLGLLVENLDDLVTGEPFGDRHLLEDCLALQQRIEHLPHTGVLGNFVFAGAQIGQLGAGQPGLRPLPVVARDQYMPVRDHAILLQSVGDAAGVGLGGDDDHGGMVERTCGLEGELARIAQAAGNQHDHDQHGKGAVEQAEGRTAALVGVDLAAPAAGGRRDARWLQPLARAAGLLALAAPAHGLAGQGRLPVRFRLAVLAPHLAPAGLFRCSP